jgi:hypothetical protein
MNIRVELSQETKARLDAEARARGVPVEKLAERLLEAAVADNPRPDGRLTVEEVHQMLSEIAVGSAGLPDLPTESFSRENIYKDRLNGRDVLPPR